MVRPVPDLPLLRWGEQLRRIHIRRRRQRRYLGAGGIGLGLLLATFLPAPIPRLVWNASASAPVGLYAVSPGAAMRVGDRVIAHVPAAVRRLAAARHYIPANVPLVKQVVAVSGDSVCALGQAIVINGRRVVERRARDGQGRAMPWWHGCVTLQGQAVFLLMAETPDSFDGRYFGPTAAADLLGKARLVWAR